jgi:hypothetical protein
MQAGKLPALAGDESLLISSFDKFSLLSYNNHNVAGKKSGGGRCYWRSLPAL